MYLLPKELNLNELVDQEINMVCVGPYDAQVAFEKGVVIQSFFKLECEIGEKKSIWFKDKWIDTSDVLKVPKQKVIKVLKYSNFQFY